MSSRIAGLDGIRALAVSAVIAYHLRVTDGGVLGVSVFFALSGYLITSVLLENELDLKQFWGRRARRLLPALVLVLIAVMLATAVVRPHKLAAYGKQAFAAACYIANWATIAGGDNYFNRFSGPGPLDHLWSLAIEEQFYVLWPLLVFGLLPKRAFAKPWALWLVTAGLAGASTYLMARHYVPMSFNNTRAYEGTDTRVAPMLIGALVALLLPLDRVREQGRGIMEALGVVALAMVSYVVLHVDEYSSMLYRGADFVTAIATVSLVLSAAHPKTFIGRLLGLAPLRWLGERSYGIYLWHLPVMAFMPATLLIKHPWARGALQVGLIVALASLSWVLLEDPIRRGKRFFGSIALVPVAAGALIAFPLISPPPPDFEQMTASLTPEQHPVELTPVIAPMKQELTSCETVVHVGDSTSLAMIGKSYLPNPEDRLDAQYRSVGVKTFVSEISGGRSIVEKTGDLPSAYEVVIAKSGYKGCYVFALGTSDAATTSGNIPGLSKRIEWMMNAADGAQVLWLTNRTLLEKGPYQNANERAWNQAIVAACTRYPNMRVYDWASETQDDWYLPDAIHPNADGAKQKAARIAKALALAFPRDRLPPRECVVQSNAIAPL